MLDTMIVLGLFAGAAAIMLGALLMVLWAQTRQPAGETAAVAVTAVVATFLGLAVHGDMARGEAWRGVRAEIIALHDRTFYCGCAIKRGKVDIRDCERPFKPGKRWRNRARVIEVEHVVPASVLAGKHPAWKRGGRKGCEADPRCSAIIFDRENLYPSIGQVNAEHGDKRMGEVPGESETHCGIEVGEVFEPPEAVKSMVAHVWLRMWAKYDFDITPQEQVMFERWLGEE